MRGLRFGIKANSSLTMEWKNGSHTLKTNGRTGFFPVPLFQFCKIKARSIGLCIRNDHEISQLFVPNALAFLALICVLFRLLTPDVNPPDFPSLGSE